MSPVIIESNGVVRLSGEISAAEIVSVRAGLEGAILSLDQSNVSVDLADLKTFNSQVLSLCLCLLRLAKKQGLSLCFSNTPSRLFDMARVGGLEFIFSAE